MSAKAWLLKIAAEVEADPSRWTKGEFARDINGCSVDRYADLAVCWCALGFANRDGVRLPKELSGTINYHVTPSLYNDSLSNAAEFVAWFRAAAELCE